VIMTTHQPPSSAGRNYLARAAAALSAPDWHEHGACRGDPNADDWFPRDKRERRSQPALRARKVCFDQCPVRQLCLEHALAHREPWGIWGGLDEKERNALFGDDRRAGGGSR